MNRIALVLVGAAAGAIVLAVAWWLWTAPPGADAGTLAQAAAVVPADADGLLVVGQPSRAARWLLRRPQAVVLLAAAAPEAEGALMRLRGTLATLAGEAQGPVTVWWRGAEMAAAARVSGGSARALRQLAALEGLPLRSAPTGSGDVDVSLASASALLEGPPGKRPQFGDHDRLTAIARAGARWWGVRAGRNRLDLATGEPRELPSASGPSVIVTDDLGRLAGLVPSSSPVPHVPAGLAFGEGGWALTLPGTVPGREVTRLLTLGGDVAVPSSAGVRQWRGVLGEIWARPGAGLAIASSAPMLAALPPPPYVGESGTVRGPELSAACVRAADALTALWLFRSRAEALRRAAPVVAAARLARWRILPDGGLIRLEW